jgi:hypothetical protein
VAGRTAAESATTTAAVTARRATAGLCALVGAANGRAGFVRVRAGLARGSPQTGRGSPASHRRSRKTFATAQGCPPSRCRTHDVTAAIGWPGRRAPISDRSEQARGGCPTARRRSAKAIAAES